MAVKDQPFKITVGDYLSLRCEIRDASNALIDLTGYSCRWALASSSESTPLIEKTTADGGIAIPNQVAQKGILFVVIDPADTKSLSGTYYHQLQVTDTLGHASTLMAGTVSIASSLFSQS